MTEQEWMTCNDVDRALEFLRGKMTQRKLWLFGCACCRRIWPLLADERSRRMVEVFERYADGTASDAELLAAEEDASAACSALAPTTGAGRSTAWLAAEATTVSAEPIADAKRRPWINPAGPRSGAEATARLTAETAAEAVALAEANDPAALANERAAHLWLLRDLAGPFPFRLIAIPVHWLTWNNGAVPRQAREIYDGHAFERLPKLADTLQAAGCTNAALLAHCREPGLHARGCWVLDLLLGKG
jgi:hypothetical protein